MLKRFEPGYRQIFLFYLTAGFCMLLERVLFTNLTESSLTPHFIPLFILFLAFYWHHNFALFFVCLLGALLDYSTATLLGPGMLAGLLAYLIFTNFADRLFINSRLILFVSAAMITAVYFLLFNLIYILFGIEISIFSWVNILNALFSAILALPLFALLNKYFLVD